MKQIPLSTLREKHSLSQRELARILNINVSTLCMYETGKRTPPLHRAIEISKFFGVPVENISFQKK